MALSHQSVVRNSGSDPLKPDLPFLGIPLECLDVGELPDFGNDSPYLFTPMYEASFKGTKR